jgi:hypothetical protein
MMQMGQSMPTKPRKGGTCCIYLPTRCFGVVRDLAQIKKYLSRPIVPILEMIFSTARWAHSHDSRWVQSLDVDREYCMKHFSNYSETAEPGFLANYYAYYCDHYVNGKAWTQNPEENAPLG